MTFICAHALLGEPFLENGFAPACRLHEPGGAASQEHFGGQKGPLSAWRPGAQDPALQQANGTRDMYLSPRLAGGIASLARCTCAHTCKFLMLYVYMYMIIHAQYAGT